MSSNVVRALAICLLTGSPLLSWGSRAQDVFIANAHLVDPCSGQVEAGNLLIEAGLIAGRPGDPPEGFGGAVVDAGGGWLIPGLRDLHVHSMVNLAPGGAVELAGTPKTAERMLRVGVTGFLDLFNTESYVLGLRDAQRSSGLAQGADIFAAGPCLTATDGHCTEYPTPTRIIDTPQQAREQIAELGAQRPDVIKIVYSHASLGATRPARPTIDRETLRAALAAADEHGIPSVIHIRSWRDVREAVEDGASAVTHLPGDAAPDGIEELLLARGTVLIPTLAVGDPVFITEPERLDEPLLRAAAGLSVIAAYESYDRNAEGAQSMLRGLATAQGHRMRTLARFAAAGVPIVAGSDSGNWFTVHGYSLHRELELYVASGLTPLAALRTATCAAGSFLGRSWGLGTGDQGSVVVVEDSPLEDIRNTRRIRAVIHHGRPVSLGG